MAALVAQRGERGVERVVGGAAFFELQALAAGFGEGLDEFFLALPERPFRQVGNIVLGEDV